MTTPATDGKMLVSTLYHSAVVSGFAIGYVKLGKALMGGPTPRLDYTPRDIGMVVGDVALGLATKDFLIKQGILPADIMK